MTPDLDRDHDLDEGLAAARAAEAVRRHTDLVPDALLMLGSGLGHVADLVETEVELPVTDVPHLPTSTVEGHAGALVLGRLRGLPVMVMRGRVHLYEGYAPREVVRPVRLARQLGARRMLVTNAAGGIREDLVPGDLMALVDHLNLTGMSPLRGPNVDALGTRFPDMSAAYDPAQLALATEVAGARGLALARGVYAALPGPQYETPAEIRMLATLGADAVGMSTVPEVIAAVHAGMSVLGVSCITNKAAGLAETGPNHEEVLETSARVRASFEALVLGVMERWAAEPPAPRG